MRDIRLGDDIDDYCVRCKRIMNHDVVSVINAAPAKVRCRTCHSDHDYRHEQAPPPKVDPRKQALFQEVLKKVSPGEEVAVDADPDIESVEEPEPEPEPEADHDLETEAAVAAAETPAKPARRKPAAKPKSKARK
jgi:hypothetical protein